MRGGMLIALLMLEPRWSTRRRPCDKEKDLGSELTKDEAWSDSVKLLSVRYILVAATTRTNTADISEYELWKERWKTKRAHSSGTQNLAYMREYSSNAKL